MEPKPAAGASVSDGGPLRAPARRGWCVAQRCARGARGLALGRLQPWPAHQWLRCEAESIAQCSGGEEGAAAALSCAVAALGECRPPNASASAPPRMTWQQPAPLEASQRSDSTGNADSAPAAAFKAAHESVPPTCNAALRRNQAPGQARGQLPGSARQAALLSHKRAAAWARCRFCRGAPTTTSPLREPVPRPRPEQRSWRDAHGESARLWSALNLRSSKGAHAAEQSDVPSRHGPAASRLHSLVVGSHRRTVLKMAEGMKSQPVRCVQSAPGRRRARGARPCSAGLCSRAPRAPAAHDERQGRRASI